MKVKTEVSVEWVKEHAGEIKKAYETALEKGYDINSTIDVMKLLKITDPSNATEENAKAFSGVLQIFDQMVKENVEKRTKLN